MKIIHCADIHLGSSLTRHLDSKRAKERGQELLKTFTNLIAFAHEQEVEAVLIAGDLFDKDNGIKNIKNLVFQTMEKYADISFYYLRGNHDTKIEADHVPPNVYYFDTKWKTYSIKGHETIKISGIELNDKNIGYIYPLLHLEKEDINLVLLHGQETNYDSKNDAQMINLKALSNKNIDYLALGHIHSYKQKSLDYRGTYCYPGCLEGRGFDETGTHGFVLLEIDEKNHFIQPTFIPFAQREIIVQEVDISGMTNSLEVLDRLKEFHYSSTSLVQFFLTGEVDMDVQIDESFLIAQMKDAYYFVKIKNQTSIKVDYSQYEYDTSLKGEFVRTVFQSKFSEAEKAELIKMGMDVLSGKEI